MKVAHKPAPVCCQERESTAVCWVSTGTAEVPAEEGRAEDPGKPGAR